MAGLGQQLGLFGPALDVTMSMKRALSAAMRNSGLSREQIVDRMNELLAGEGLAIRVTINALEKWAAPSARHMISVPLLPFFCRATGSLEPLRVLAGALGVALAGPRELRLMELGEATLQSREAARLRRRALEALEGLK
jgi:hypothetical protein